MKNLLKIFGISVIFILLDQVTKYLALTYLAEPFVIIKNFFQLQYVQNTGVAFSLNLPYFLIIISNIVLLALVLALAYKELNLADPKAKIFLAMLVGGGIGNLIDRIFSRHVLDFISIWKYPFFNLADAFITVAVLLLIIFYGKIKQVRK